MQENKETHLLIKQDEACDSVEFQILQNVECYHRQTRYSCISFQELAL